MRQFYLVNEVGTTYFFDYRNQTLISDIDDIGYENENTYLTYENTFKKVDEKVPQKDISFSESMVYNDINEPNKEVKRYDYKRRYHR